jgi:hypothetical protein
VRGRQRQPQAFTSRSRAGLRYRLNMQRSEPKRGSAYREDGCDCGLPPWELCRADCQHAASAALEPEQQRHLWEIVNER